MRVRSHILGGELRIPSRTRELTERELEVLVLLDGELSARQMAQKLYVSPNTARAHIQSIYRKLGTSSRGEAVEEARARGLL